MKRWYDRVKKDLIEISTKLKSPDTTQEEREKLYIEQIDLMIELDEIYDVLCELAK